MPSSAVAPTLVLQPLDMLGGTTFTPAVAVSEHKREGNNRRAVKAASRMRITTAGGWLAGAAACEGLAQNNE
jgi:hypothetical protein